MPMPESRTSKVTSAKSSGAGRETTRSTTSPLSVNLIALPTRLRMTCLSLWPSATTQSTTSGANSRLRDRRFAFALVSNRAMAVFASDRSEIGASVRLIFPASIFEWSRTSLRMLISDVPDEAAVRTSARCSASSGE